MRAWGAGTLSLQLLYIGTLTGRALARDTGAGGGALAGDLEGYWEGGLMA